jgi:hypothetical protein
MMKKPHRYETGGGLFSIEIRPAPYELLAKVLKSSQMSSAKQASTMTSQQPARPGVIVMAGRPF